MITGIACVGKNWEIGKNNKLLFNIPEDMKFFRTTTANSIVVMGEKTLQSFPGGRPLKGRTNIVLCRPGHNYDGCICVYSVEDLINWVKHLSTTNYVYIIGGGFIYNLFIPYYDTLVLTKVDATDPEATVFFPNIDKMPEFKQLRSLPIFKDPSTEYNFDIVTYERVRN